jgi:hypothetical protein
MKDQSKNLDASVARKRSVQLQTDRRMYVGVKREKSEKQTVMERKFRIDEKC